MAQDFAFRSFLLQVSKDLTSNDFIQIKYLLKGYVPNAKCEEIKTVCNYFEELERMCLLSPTNFGVLKMALNAIGRQDLVEMIEQKELYFADLFKEKKGDSLGQKEYDAVCDGITKAAETLEVFSRSGHNTSELQKKLKLAILENEDDVQLEEISDVLTTSVMPTAVTELGKQKRIKKEEQPTYMEMRTGDDNDATVEPSPQIDNAECVKIPLEEAAESNNGGGAMATKDHLLESKTTEHEFTSVENSTPKSDQKEPSEDTVPDCNEQEETEKTQVKHNMAEATTGVTGVPSNTIPSYSSHQKLNDDVVTDGKDDDKGKGADSNDDAKTTSKEAEHLSPQHYHGPGARPKDPILKTAKTAGPSEAAEQKATAQAEQAEHLGPQHSHGQGARPKKPLLKTGKTASPSEAAEQKATEQADQVAETNPHGTLFVESSSEHFDTLHPETANSKQPTESEYSSPSSPTGDVISIDDGNESDELYSDENEGAELLKEKPKSTMYSSGQGAGTSASKGPLGCYHPPGVFSSKASYPKAFGYGGHAVPEDCSLPGGESTAHGPGHGASASASASKGPLGCHHPPGVFSSTPSYQKASGYSGPAAPDGWSLSELMGLISAMDLPVEPNVSQMPYQQQMAILYQLVTLQQSVNEAQGLNPSTNPIPPHYSSTSTSHSDHAADSPLQANCYSKAGYSVVITNGVLCENTDEKGVVMMESGTQFCIAVANDNNYAAEVDITFGGMYLGVWVLEAKQSLSSPLIIQGSSWAAGRLRFFSASDVKKPKPSADIYGENPALNGRIELEFKPEVKTMKVYAKHVRKEELVEISIIDSKTATVGDLKQEISKKWKSDISYLMKGGKVLQEERTISSYALNENEVIEVLNAEEELMIESVGRDPVTMMVDPHNVSVESVKNFILKEIKIEVDEQLLRFKGQDIDVDFESLTQMLITSKKVPVLKVDRDRNINVMVRLPDRGSEEKIAINWFATVDDLKEKLEERNICNTSATLIDNETGEEISRQGSKKLIDLGFKNKSEITVVQTKRSTHRGFSTSAFDGFGGSGTRGFGGGLLGFDNHVSPAETYRGFSSGTRAFRNGPEKMEHDSSDEDGVAILYGTEKSVYEDFQVDKSEQQFSKEKAVTLVIQLKAKSMGATGGAGAAASPRPPAQSGAHYSGGPTGPMSTPTPPPVPE